MSKHRTKGILLAALTYAAGVYTFQLPDIPGEWFGDISNVHEYMQDVLSGAFPMYFFQSPGPAYHYLITPIVYALPNMGYDTYKAASSIVGIATVAATYLLIRQAYGETRAAITALIMGGSFWFIIWSRLGNSQVMIPLLYSTMGYFFIRYVKRRMFRYAIFSAVFSSFGWYTYPHTFIFPLVFLVSYTLALAGEKGKNRVQKIREYSGIIIVLLVLAVPFVRIIKTQTENFGASGYVGQKVLPVLAMSPREFLWKLAGNSARTALMLHQKGDSVFRINVAGRPQLDRVSGGIFLIGLASVWRKNRKHAVYILGLLGALILPSISPAIPDGEIPNSGRTIAITPIVYFLVASGVWEIYRRIRKWRKVSSVWAAGGVSMLFGYIAYANLTLYFISYVRGLPDKNLAPGKSIAAFVDKFPHDATLYFASCCWKEAGQPENKGVVYQLRKTKRQVRMEKLIASCEEIDARNALVLIDPADEEKIEKFTSCTPNAEVYPVIGKDKEPVARIVALSFPE